MGISTDKIKQLRELSGAGVMDCRNALLKTQGDIEAAYAELKAQGWSKAAKKAGRATKQGLVESYIHQNGRIGAMVEVNCESDFVARTDEFRSLVHELALQVAAMSPCYINPEEVPEEERENMTLNCLLRQPYIKDPSRTVGDLVVEMVARLGENIRVSRFARFELGEPAIFNETSQISESTA